MLPVFSMNNRTHSGRTNSVLSSKAYYLDCAIRKFFPYGSHFVFGQFGKVAGLTFVLSALFYLICHIVGLCPKKEMLWIYASRVVAFVKDKQAFVERPICKLVGKPVSHYPLVVVTYNPVSAGIFSACPKYASSFGCLPNALLESDRKWHGKTFCRTLVRAEAPRILVLVSLDPGKMNSENCLADFADSFNRTSTHAESPLQVQCVGAAC